MNLSIKQMTMISLMLLGPGVIWQTYTQALLADGTVMGAATFETAAHFATPTPTPSVSPTPPTGIANHVVISEVQISSTGSGGNEKDFIELYNPTNIPFDLKGHRIVKRTASSPNDVSIKAWDVQAIVPAHGYYLWASSDGGYAVTIGADASTADNIAPANSIALRQGAENTGTIVDALNWSSSTSALKEGTQFIENPGDDQSLERKALSISTLSTMEGGADAFKGNGYDSDNNATDFVLRTISQPQNSLSPTEAP